MVLDRLKNASFYRGVHARVTAALDYLSSHDFTQVPDGNYELEGERVFAIVQRYRGRTMEDAVWESHKRYLDVQYIAQGAERMGYVCDAAEATVTQPYDDAKDVMFFDARGDLLSIRAGGFVVFAPGEIHSPGIVSAEGDDGEIVKVVVKCLMP